MNDITDLLKKAKEASKILALTPEIEINKVLTTLSNSLKVRQQSILEANKLDLKKMDESNPLYDRLKLTSSRIEGISEALREVADLPSPLGEVMEERVLPNGIELSKVRVPFGVVGVVYEARPNVTIDVFALCLKSGNACVLKGGSDADNTNQILISLIHDALKECGLPEDCCVLLPASHESTRQLLGAVGYVDVCIPRGGRSLINFVRDNAKVPVIETGAGVVHTYFDKDGDIEIGKKVIDNGKTRRVSVCNALDTLLIHRDRLPVLPKLTEVLAKKGVKLHVDPKAFEALEGKYPSDLLIHADTADKDKEWMDMILGIYTVESVEEAIDHISRHGSGHSESIVTENQDIARLFTKLVDAACVYVNLPTSFTDGGEFGLGAEIGISTQKLGPRGPMGLKEITTYKYILNGEGQTRP